MVDHNAADSLPRALVRTDSELPDIDQLLCFLPPLADCHRNALHCWKACFRTVMPPAAAAAAAFLVLLSWVANAVPLSVCVDNCLGKDDKSSH